MYLCKRKQPIYLNMRINRLILLIIIACMSAGTHAQVTDKYLAALDSLRQAYVDWKYQGGDTLSNPYLFQLISAPSLYQSTTASHFHITRTPQGQAALSSAITERTQAINRQLLAIYATQPWLVKTVVGEKGPLGPKGRLPEQERTTVAVVPPPVVVAAPLPKEEVAPAAEVPERMVDDMEAFHIKVKRPNFWDVKGKFNMQLQQTSISNNWYQGGSDSYSVNGYFELEGNYNNKQRVTWDNKLEARLGFQTISDYDINSFKPSTDKLRFTSKFGLQAFKHWYYSLSLQAWTQMLKAHEVYKEDGIEKERVKSDFMSPFEGILSLGMDYKLEKKKFKLNANIAPLALNYKHVSRTLYKPQKNLYEIYGLENHDRFEFGSTLTANASWMICKMLRWDSRLYFFTSYHRTTAEMENTFTLKVNKYLSTKLYLYPRFDDGVARTRRPVKEGHEGEDPGFYSYFQLQEFFSFGLDISF